MSKEKTTADFEYVILCFEKETGECREVVCSSGEIKEFIISRGEFKVSDKVLETITLNNRWSSLKNLKMLITLWNKFFYFDYFYYISNIK